MKILITGANGFLGSHLVKHFASHGNEIYAVSLHTDRLRDVMDRIEFDCCSMSRITSIQPRINAFQPDVVIHCAWEGGNNYLDTNSSKQFYKNIPGLADLLETIKQCKIKRFIGIGSGSEYGDKPYIIDETVTENPISLYGVCKLMSKTYSEQFCKNENIRWTWLRPFYTYGPNDVQTRLIPNTIIKCLKKEEISLTKCESKIDYLYIDDFVNAMDSIIHSKKDGLFNICSMESYRIKTLIDFIGYKTKNKSNLNFGTLSERTNYPTMIRGNSCKLQNATLWKPTISIYEGLIKTIEFYKNI